MPISVEDFSALVDDLEEVFDEVANTKVAEMSGNKVFRVSDTNRRTYDLLLTHGVAGIDEVTPGQDLPIINAEQGDTATWTQRYFGGRPIVTKEMRLFDLHDQIEDTVRSVSEEAFDKVDQSLADALLYGYATSYSDVYGKTIASTTPDGVELFGTHTNAVSSRTFSNILNDGTNANPTLSRAAVVAGRVQGMVLKDPNNLVRPVMLDTLIVPPSLEDLAHRIVFSDGVQGSANVDSNPLKGKIKKIITWERLETRSDGTDTSAYWFLGSSSQMGKTLRALFAERPSLDPPDQVYANKNWEWTIDFFYTIGLGWPAYIFGSNGANA